MRWAQTSTDFSTINPEHKIQVQFKVLIFLKICKVDLFCSISELSISKIPFAKRQEKGREKERAGFQTPEPTSAGVFTSLRPLSLCEPRGRRDKNPCYRMPLVRERRRRPIGLHLSPTRRTRPMRGSSAFGIPDEIHAGLSNQQDAVAFRILIACGRRSMVPRRMNLAFVADQGTDGHCLGLDPKSVFNRSDRRQLGPY